MRRARTPQPRADRYRPDPEKCNILIHCKSGMRSQLAAIELIKAGWVADRLFNLEGGIMAWKLQSPEDIES